MTAYFAIQNRTKARNIIRTGVGIHPTTRLKSIGRKNIHSNSFLAQVSQITKVPVEKLTSKHRGNMTVSTARMLFMKIAFENSVPKLTRAKIGMVVNRDNATVFHAQKTINSLLTYDKTVQTQYEKLLSIGNFRRLE